MAFNGKKTVEFNGQPLPYRGVRLITSPLFREKRVDGNVVFNVTPYGIAEDGTIIRPTKTVEVEQEVDGQTVIVSVVVDDNSLDESRIYGDSYEAAKSDALKAKALGLISQGIQILIDVEGL